MSIVIKRKQTSEKRKLTSVSRLIRNWTDYQQKTWVSAADEHADMRDMGVIVSTRTIREWRKGALPEKSAWVLILKLGWPFLIDLLGESLAASYELMEEDYERSRKESLEVDRQIIGLLRRHTSGGGKAISDPD